MEDSEKNKHYGIIFRNGNYRLVVNNNKHAASMDNYVVVGYYDNNFNYIKLDAVPIRKIDGYDAIYTPHVCKIILENGLEIESSRIELKSKQDVKEYYKSFT